MHAFVLNMKEDIMWETVFFGVPKQTFFRISTFVSTFKHIHTGLDLLEDESMMIFRCTVPLSERKQ